MSEANKITDVYIVIVENHWDHFGEIAYCTNIEIAQSLANEHCQNHHSANINYWMFDDKESSWSSVVKNERKSGKPEWIATYEIVKEPLNKLISGG